MSDCKLFIHTEVLQINELMHYNKCYRQPILIMSIFSNILHTVYSKLVTHVVGGLSEVVDQILETHDHLTEVDSSEEQGVSSVHLQSFQASANTGVRVSGWIYFQTELEYFCTKPS